MAEIARVLRFETALTPRGWANDVMIRIDGEGRIAEWSAGLGEGPVIRGAAIPGLANLHSHAFQRAMAGLTERAGPGEDSFWTWREEMYRFLAVIDPDDAEAIAAFAYREMLERGFTAVAEFHYLHHQPDGRPYDDPAEMTARHVAAAETTGIGLTMLPVLYAHGGFRAAPPTEGQRRFVSDIPLFERIVEAADRLTSGRPGMTAGVAPHSLRAATPDMLREIAGLLPGRPRHIHVSEQTGEVEACRVAHATTPIALLAETVDLGPDWCLIHATHATHEERALMARAGLVAGLCPVTEANLGDGIFPAQDYLAAGGRFGVGTDSNVLIRAADELRQLEYSQRLAARRRNVLAPRGGSTGRRLYDAALAGGAQALGRAAHGFAVGAPADMVVLDTDDPSFVGRAGDRLIDTLVFGAGGAAIRDVFALGRQVVKDGRHVRREEIAARYARTMRRLLQS